VTARLRPTFSMTPFISNHGRNARRICSENEMPSRSCRRRIASIRSSSSLPAALAHLSFKDACEKLVIDVAQEVPRLKARS
jgi:hypothetical protein